MAAQELFVLAEVDNLCPVFAPLKSTNRIKYTCFCVSKTFLIFGATSGGLYVFKREPCIFLQLLPNKEGSVTQVSVSPDEKYFAFATLKGAVCILERSQLLKIRRTQSSNEHIGREVTALQWNNLSNELFVGDESGKVSSVSVSPFMAKKMFQNPTFTLMQLDSRIVQLDWYAELLLVSTLTRCYVCDTFREQYRQIGQKLRDGEYGACLYVAGDVTEMPVRSEPKETSIGRAFSSLNEGEKLSCFEGIQQNLKMFCARPGSRLWQVHIDGTVLSTLQFKQALAVPPVGIVKTYEISDQFDSQSDESSSPQTFNFTKLYVILSKFLFTFKRDGICVLDPMKGGIVLWSNSYKDIVDAKTVNDIMYIWTASSQFHAVSILPLDKFLVRLYLRKQYELCANLCLHYNNYLLELAPASSKLQLLADLGNKLENKEIATKVSPLLEEITKHAQEKQNAQRLKSGIFLVGNTHFFWNEEEEEKKKEVLQTSPLVQSLRVAERKEKSRSLNASPERSQRRKRSVGQPPQRRTGSTLSLPELEQNSSTPEVSTASSTLEVPQEPADSIQSSKSKPHLRSTKSSDSFYTQDSPFQPEAIQAFKDLTQNLSLKLISPKTLKEKWQLLEGKMKLLNQETNQEPLDIRPVNYKEPTTGEKALVEDSEVVHSSTEKPKQKTPLFPPIEVLNVSQLCKRLVENEKDVEDTSNLSEFLESFNNTYDLFTTTLRQSCDIEVNNDAVQISNLKSGFCPVGPFPFSYYFPDDTLRMIREYFHMAVKSGILFSWAQEKSKDIQQIPKEQFPECFDSYCTENILKYDTFLSKVLIIFSEILDPKLILLSIKSAELPCYYLSLSVILDRYHEGNFYYMAKESSEHDSYDELPLPLLLNTLFYMLSMERIETCYKLSKRVCVKDVWYLILRLQQQMEKTGKGKETARLHCFSIFLSYLDKLSASKDCFTELLPDDQLRSFVTSVFLELNYIEGGACKCGFPLLNSPTLQFRDLAELLVVYYWENSQGHLIEMCKKVPSLWHLILPRKRSGEFSSVLSLIIHLGNLSELSNWTLKMDESDWEQTVELLVIFRSATCLNCGSSFIAPTDHVKGISWSSLGSLMIKGLGPKQTIELFTKYSSHIDPGELDERFFQSCILSAIVDNHTKDLRGEVVDIMNEETALFSDVVGSTLEEALREDLGRPLELKISSEKHHWGGRINLEDGDCPCCSLPLSYPALMQDGGVTTFRCGHTFHMVCLRKQSQLFFSCLICTKKS